MQENISTDEKKIIENFIDRLGCNKLTGITASFVSDNTNIAIDIVKRRLLELGKGPKLQINYELECPQCARTIQTYKPEDKIPFDELMECIDCEEVFKVELENIWVTYDPNENYFSEDYCKNILRENKKKEDDILKEIKKNDEDNSKSYVDKNLLKNKDNHLEINVIVKSFILIVFFIFSCIIALIIAVAIVKGNVPAIYGATILTAFFGIISLKIVYDKKQE